MQKCIYGTDVYANTVYMTVFRSFVYLKFKSSLERNSKKKNKIYIYTYAAHTNEKLIAPKHHFRTILCARISSTRIWPHRNQMEKSTNKQIYIFRLFTIIMPFLLVHSFSFIIRSSSLL